jgi:hypothetical protein
MHRFAASTPHLTHVVANNTDADLPIVQTVYILHISASTVSSIMTSVI